MAAFADVVLADGRIDLTEDGAACVLWLHVPAQEQAGDDPDDIPARVREVVDPENERAGLVDRLAEGIHPAGCAHEYPWMIGVTPARQGEGLGAALVVESVLDRCDREGLPTCLEASGARSRGLYERLGVEFTRQALDLPDGPRMWPKWRDPHGTPTV